jgi:hypothetical protein
MPRLIETLQDVIEAERQAAELRRKLGTRAEGLCDTLIAARRKGDPERERLQDVRRALRWI